MLLNFIIPAIQYLYEIINSRFKYNSSLCSSFFFSLLLLYRDNNLAIAIINCTTNQQERNNIHQLESKLACCDMFQARLTSASQSEPRKKK